MTMQTVRRIANREMITTSSSKLSLFCISLLSEFSSSLSTISLSILPSIFLSSLISYKKSVPRTLVSLFFVNTIYLFVCENSFVDAQLIINLRNRGGEVFQEAISANTSEDVIEVELQNTDGSLISQLIDFKNNLVLFRLILLNEQDILDDSQQKYQRLCYVTLLNQSDFISSEDISKLRQRNPSAIREAEHDKGKEKVYMNFKLSVTEGGRLSSHISRFCASGGQESAQIYARYEDLISLAPDLLDDLDNESDDSRDRRDDYMKDEDLKEDNIKMERIDKLKDAKYSLMHTDKKANKDDLLERNMKNRCFMQKFSPTIVVEDNISNYEKLKIRLRKQMMSKVTKGLNDHSTHDRLEDKSKLITKDTSLAPKSLNDFNNYWQDRKNGRQPVKLLDLFQHPKKSVNNSPSACYCKIEICIPWYPCQVKYCHRTTDRPSVDKTTSTVDLNSRPDRVRCGIESCKKCWRFYYQVDSKNSCLWDDE